MKAYTRGQLLAAIASSVGIIGFGVYLYLRYSDMSDTAWGFMAVGLACTVYYGWRLRRRGE